MSDSKIVQLAKKGRKLTVALSKERSYSESIVHSNVALTKAVEELQSQLSLTRQPVAMQGSEDGLVTKKELALAQKNAEDLRIKLSISKEENRQLNQTLVRELGDACSVDQALDGQQWKGRARTLR